MSLCLGSGYHKLSTYIDYLNFHPKSRTFSKKINLKVSEALSEMWISSSIFSKPRQNSIVFHNVLVISLFSSAKNRDDSE